MKKGLLFAILTLCAVPLHAQDLPIEQFNAPSFPAGSVIGFEANEISRPRSLQDVRVSIQNNFLDSANKLVIPDNYAIEINPFMISPRKNFDYRDYLKSDFWSSFKQNSTLSIAATNSYLVNDSVKTNALGFGTRLVLYNGKVSQDVESAYTQQLAYLDTLRQKKLDIGKWLTEYTMNMDDQDLIDKSLLTDYLAEHLTANQMAAARLVLKDMDTLTAANLSSKYDRTCDQLQDHDKNVAIMKELIRTVRNDRHGLHVELNGALALHFPTNDFAFSMVPRGGVWLNISYLPLALKSRSNGNHRGVSNFEFTGLARYMWSSDEFYNRYVPVDSSIFQIGNYFDVGLRVDYTAGKFSAGLEYIYRQQRNTETVTLISGEQRDIPVLNDNYKLNLNLNYRLTNQILLTYNLGKNYLPGGTSGNLICTLSVNLGLGQLKKEDLLGLGKK